MSNQFIGLTMLVTLSSPPGAQLRGVVSSIEPGKSLTLRNVTCPSNGKYLPEFTINASEIVELVEAVDENAPPAPIVPTPVSPIPVSKAWEDPAILSVGRKPTSATRPSISGPQWGSISMERVESTRTVRRTEDTALKDITADTILVAPLQHIALTHVEPQNAAGGLNVEELEAEVQIPLEQQVPKRRIRRRRHGQQAAKEIFQEPEVIPAKETTRSKGWRNTPLLEPNPSFQPFATLKGRKGRGRGGFDENGWATEDATDVQDMGDFDFIGSLAKFDKHSVFEKIQAEDNIPDEDRLVSHNRLPRAKPGTAGGKNLHYTENVLDLPNGSPKSRPEAWISGSDESDREEKTSARNAGSGRQSRRAESKLATNRKPPSRKESSITSAQPARTHPTPTRALKPTFYLVPSDRRCEPISALQMINLENIADNELGLSEDMITENAGRGIAEVALSALNSDGGGIVQGKSSTTPTVVVLAGNNKSGLRGVAAGRHLRNHGINVVVCVLGLERESEFLDGFRRQINVFRNFDGKVVGKVELLEYVKGLDVPVQLIIDGLLGLTLSFEELRRGDQATAYELIEWTNRNKAPVLAIDIPTCIEPTSGKISIIDGRQLYIHANYVVAMGAPKKGLLEAMALGEGVSDEDGVGNGKGWQLFVADIGLGAAVWKKAGARVRRVVEFEGSWVVAMRFQGGAE